MNQNHSVMIDGMHFPETFPLRIENIPGAEEFCQRRFVKIGDLLTCVNSKAGVVPRITLDDIFGRFACLSRRDGVINLVWFSDLEYCIHEYKIPIKRLAEIYILEEWAIEIDHIVTIKAFIARLDAEWSNYAI